MSGFSLVRFEREIFPFLQATQWVSGAGGAERDRLGGAYDLVFPHGLLEKFRRDARKFPDGDAVGLLYGTGRECPWTRRLWVRVDAVAMEDPPARRGWLRRRPRTRDELSIGQRIEALAAHGDPPSGALLGWVRTRQTDALVMFASETETHATTFREPWQVAVLLAAPGSDGGYGIFGRDEDGQIRDARPRPFYEREPERGSRSGKSVSPPNYRIVERATELPGGSRAWREVRRRKASALGMAACLVFGVAGGLALSYELSRATRPGGFLAPEPALAFASPADAVEPVEEGPLARAPEERILGYFETFERNVARFNRLVARPTNAATYCDDLASAYSGVHGSFVTLSRKRDELDPTGIAARLELADQEKRRVDARFDRADCRR
ncbi:MAG: hypothetical protein R3195_11265 [Gemmatimonadota bacterium]|nr:hypothetical protein [Gemmatimonadota bacterium]